MSDRIPKVTIDDVFRIIRGDFPRYDSKTILDILNEYSSDSEGSRVHVAALKLSEGDIEKLQEWIELANIDFRDVISPAEYPRFNEIGFVGIDKLSRKEVNKLKDYKRLSVKRKHLGLIVMITNGYENILKFSLPVA